MRQHEAVVQLGAPAHQALGAYGVRQKRAIKRAQQQLLREAHARVRRHLERAQLEQAQAPRRAIGRVELVDAELGAMRVAGDVDQQIAEQAIDEPRRRVVRRSGGISLERDLELVERVVARFVRCAAPARSGR